MRMTERGRVAKWSREKVDTLSTPELRQLLVNAERLNEPEVAALCNELLGARPRGFAAVRKQRPKGEVRHLVTRGKAFEMNGVTLQSRFWSRSGIREADGTIVMSMWSDDAQKIEGGNKCLLWAPNVAGARPWSDKPGGQERLAHCRLAVERGGPAEGLLVYGQRLEGSLPEDKAMSVDGVDADYVLSLTIEKRGEEYWASWPETKRAIVRNMP